MSTVPIEESAAAAARHRKTEKVKRSILTKLSILARLQGVLTATRNKEKLQAEENSSTAATELLETPVEWAESFECLLSDLKGRKAFTEFLSKEYSQENMTFWTSCCQYEVTDVTERKRLANEIFDRHLAEDASREPVNVDSTALNEVKSNLAQAPSHLFDTAKTQIFVLMKTDKYRRFLSSEFSKCVITSDPQSKTQCGGNEKTANNGSATSTQEPAKGAQEILSGQCDSAKVSKPIDGQMANKAILIIKNSCSTESDMWNNKTEVKTQAQAQADAIHSSPIAQDTVSTGNCLGHTTNQPIQNLPLKSASSMPRKIKKQNDIELEDHKPLLTMTKSSSAEILSSPDIELRAKNAIASCNIIPHPSSDSSRTDKEHNPMNSSTSCDDNILEHGDAERHLANDTIQQQETDSDSDESHNGGRRKDSLYLLRRLSVSLDQIIGLEEAGIRSTNLNKVCELTEMLEHKEPVEDEIEKLIDTVDIITSLSPRHIEDKGGLNNVTAKS